MRQHFHTNYVKIETNKTSLFRITILTLLLPHKEKIMRIHVIWDINFKISHLQMKKIIQGIKLSERSVK